MADLAPEEVADVFAQMPSTKNWTVAYDRVQAANSMPAKIAVKLIDVIGNANQSTYTDYILTDIGKLVEKLVLGGEIEAALKLTKSCFVASGDPDSFTRKRQSDFSYFEGMRNHVIPNLSRTSADKFISIIATWLEDIVQIPDRHGSVKDQTSFIWRPAIEDHEQNSDYKFASNFLGCVRDACEIAIHAKQISIEDVCRILDYKTGHVFVRLRLHLLTEFGHQNPELTCSEMMNRDHFASMAVIHEYARLFRTQWILLNQIQQDEWLEWVDQGPEGIRPEYYDEPDDPERIDRQRNYWKFKRLHWIHAHLSGEKRDFYDKMHKEYGEPELADLNFSQSSFRSVETESPYTLDELTSLTFVEAVEKVSTWKPSPDTNRFEGPNLEGLSHTFGTYLAQDPVAFSREAMAVRKCGPMFVRRFFETMQQAAKDSISIDLKPVLELAQWVLSHPDDEKFDHGDDGGLVDRDWQWTRDSIASMVEEITKSHGCKGKPAYGIQYRDDLWTVIEPLVSFPAKSYIVENQARDPREVDWLTVMLNSTRGKAMQAVLAFAEWVGELLSGDQITPGSLEGGFDAIPEVKALLEAELTRPDADFGGRAAFGSRMGLLYNIDQGWLDDHCAHIFDLRKIETDPAHAFGWAAWVTFLFSSHPHRVFYRMLQDQFSYAIDQSIQLGTNEDTADKHWNRLGEHLMVLYGRGDLGSDSKAGMEADNAILLRLISKTPVSIRSHAVKFVGRSLSGQKEKLPQEVLDRFADLWEIYWRDIGQQDAKNNPQSSVFGYWFSSGALDPQWSLAQLEEFVSAAPRAEPDHLIVEHLATVCTHDPLRSVKIIQMLVMGDVEGWRIPSWKKEAKKILQIAMSAKGDACELAKQVIDALGRRGYLEFGELLQEAN